MARIPVATDDFSSCSDGALPQPPWRSLTGAGYGGAFVIDAGVARPSDGSAAAACRTTETYNNNQYSKVYEASGTYVGLILRGFDQSDTGNHYDCYLHTDGNDGQIYVQVNGVQTAIGSTWSSTPLGTGGFGVAEIVGEEIQVYVNGIAQFVTPRTNASLQSGSPGILGYLPASRMDNWEGGSIVFMSHYPLPSFYPTY